MIIFIFNKTNDQIYIIILLAYVCVAQRMHLQLHLGCMSSVPTEVQSIRVNYRGISKLFYKSNSFIV
jgi:hypothetical protein